MKRILGHGITVAAFIFVAYFLYSGIVKSKSLTFHFNPWFLIASLTACVFFFLLRASLLKRIISNTSHAVTLFATTKYLLSSDFYRYIPGNVWGFGARLIKAQEIGLSKTAALTQMILEHIALLSGSSIISGAGLLFIHGLPAYARVLGILLCITPFVFLLLPFLYLRFTAFLSKITNIVIEPMVFSLSRTLSYVFHALLVWLMFGIAHYMLFASLFTLSKSLLAPVVCFSILAWLIGFSSLLTPSGLGVRELTLTVSFSVVVPSSVAGAFSIISRIWLTCVELMVLLVTLLLSKTKVLAKKNYLHEDRT